MVRCVCSNSVCVLSMCKLYAIMKFASNGLVYIAGNTIGVGDSWPQPQCVTYLAHLKSHASVFFSTLIHFVHLAVAAKLVAGVWVTASSRQLPRDMLSVLLHVFQCVTI